MADRDSELRFLQSIHVRIGLGIDIFISTRPKITNFAK